MMDKFTPATAGADFALTPDSRAARGLPDRMLVFSGLDQHQAAALGIRNRPAIIRAPAPPG